VTDSESPADRERRSRSSDAWPKWLRVIVRIVLTLLGLAASAALAVVMVAAIALAVSYPNLPEIDSLTDYRPKLPMRVFSADGVLLGEFGEERRSFVPIAQIPKVMQDAVLAVEDARFYKHKGVDYVGALRAGLANFGEGHTAQGASTITMQVARNFYLSTEKTFTRKIYEMLLSLKIESLLSKDQILEIYMNHIALGQRAYGFASASEIYFGKPLKDITIAEAAMLAGCPRRRRRTTRSSIPTVPRGASATSSIACSRTASSPSRSATRRSSRSSSTARRRKVAVHAEYVAEQARQMIFNQYGAEAYTRGLNVYLTLNSAEQTLAYHALRKGIMDYEKRQVYRGPEDYVDLPATAASSTRASPRRCRTFPTTTSCARRRHRGVGEEGRRHAAERRVGDGHGDGLKPAASALVAKANPKTQLRPGAVVRLIRGAKGEWSITQLPEVEGALRRDGSAHRQRPRDGRRLRLLEEQVQPRHAGVAPARLELQAVHLLGGAGEGLHAGDGDQRRAALLRRRHDRQPALGAEELRRHLRRPDDDAARPREVEEHDLDPHPQVDQPGLRAAVDQALRLRRRQAPAYLPMALGAGAVTPLQMASAYSVFANGGYRVNPLLISRITDSKGHVINEARVPTLDESARTIDARNAFIMTSLLQEVTRTGTAAKAQATLKRPDVYGKTGTTNDSHDAWFAGWQKNIVAVVWMGYDDPRKLGDRETGGGLSLPVWIDYMATMLKGVPVQEPPRPRASSTSAASGTTRSTRAAPA
jgi:penicillin-binding protein 1A